MGLYERFAARREDGRFCDIGVPDLVEPEHVRIRVLGSATSRRYDGAFVVDVHAPGREPVRGEVRSGMKPSSLGGLVPGFFVPGIVDRANPSRILLVEPPCGPDLPLVDPKVQQNRDMRDLRTAALLHRYPPPSTARLFELMEPTASAAHPLWDAVRFRMGLMTGPEARAVLDRIRADGNAWDEAQVAVNPAWHLLGSDFFTPQAECLSHLGKVAPGGREIDEQPLMSIGLAVLLRELHREQVDPDAYARLVRPFVEVCGPIDGS
ncbi:hypothetical protein [Leucobacter tenebrionis]|uniref:hypothetical protein n=1 Tax=Leucobacter tenebrionis TaxID=2873270 RepID=UPI001CA75F1D|nr:hypothetical protein [Leucobacter tenebrionis]QZY52393.1 hypothetical protein KVY00_02690 [Leucobacter tenebrionis]